MFYITVWLHKNEFDFLHFLMSKRHRIPGMTLSHFFIFITVCMGTVVWISTVSFSMSQLWTVDRWRAPDHWSALMMSQRHGDRCRFNGIYYIYMHVSWALACITREWGTRARNIRLSAASVQILRAEHVIPVSNGSTAAGFHAPWMFPFIRVLHQGGMRLTVCALLFRVCRVGWSVNGARRSLHPSPLLALFRVSAVTVPRR